MFARFRFALTFISLLFLTALANGAEICLSTAPDGTPQGLATAACEQQCFQLNCGKYFDQPDFSCAKRCRDPGQSALEIVGQCLKRGTVDVLVGIAKTPVALADLMSKTGDAIEKIDKYPELKRQLALEAAVLTKVSSKALADYTPEEKAKADALIRDIDVIALVNKRAQVQDMALTDRNYQAWLAKNHIPVGLLEKNTTAADDLLKLVTGKLKDLGYELQCYDGAERTELVCEAVGSFFAPAGAAKLLAKIPLPKGQLLRDFARDESSGNPSRGVESREVPSPRDTYTEDFLHTKTTTTEQNKSYLASKKDPNERVYFVAEHAELKDNNDRLKNKNFVTAMTNRFHQLMNEEMEKVRAANPGLTASLDGSTTETVQQDFKAYRIALGGKIPPDLDAQLDRAFQAANEKFKKELRDRHVIRPEDDPSKWFRAGRGSDADHADLRARQARDQAPGENLMAIDQDPKTEILLQQKYETVQQTRADLEKAYGSSPIMQGSPGSKIPDKQVFGLIKIYKDPQALAQAVRSRFHTQSFNTADAQRLIEYDKQVNHFPVGIHEAERNIVNLDKGKQGGMTLDFRNMNIANKEATAEALAKSNSLRDAVTRARAGEVKVTEVFKAKRDEFKKMRVGAECTGDDCAEAFITKKMTLSEKQAVVREAASNDKLRETRIAFVKDGVKNVNDRNTIGTHGEGIEKYMRGRLQTSLPPEVIDRLTFATDMQTRTLNTGRVDLIIGTPPDLKLTTDQLTRIRESLAKAVQDQNDFLYKEEKIHATYSVGPDAAQSFVIIPHVDASQKKDAAP